MSQYAKRIQPHAYPYAAMPLEQRSTLLPERNVCSLAPAKKFDEAFYTGNGTHRLDVLGDPYQEEIKFTQEMLYEPVWAKTPEPPDLTAVLPEVRRLLREGKFVEAAELVEKAQMESAAAPLMRRTETGVVVPPWPPDRTNAFSLTIRQPQKGPTSNYLRWLNMTDGCITVQWDNDAGTYRRESVASYQGDVCAVRLTPPRQGLLDVELGLRLPLGGYGGLKRPEKCTHQITIDDNLMVLEFAYYPEYGQKGYLSVVRLVRSGGTAKTTENGVVIQGADSLLILSRTVKFESNFAFGNTANLINEVLALPTDFDALLAANAAYIGSRMGRSRIRLGKDSDFALSGEELLHRTHTTSTLDPTMLEKLYDMGRFYLIIDTGELPPFWGQHNINTNLQVCAGNNTGLFDEMDIYFRFYETKFDAFRTNARKLFGARGLLASVHCDYDSGLLYHFSKNYPHYCWTGTLGWIYNELWGYWLITGDKEFLKTRLVPALKEIALFFEDYACDFGPDGKRIFYPSFSPENPTPEFATRNGVYATSINSVMDIMICREVLDNLMEACHTLGIEQENIAHWQQQKASLPDYLLDEEGGLKEWAWNGVNENYNHRHVSHHYDIWPGHLVTWEDEPELAQAIQISNRKRAQQDDSAHGIIHRLFTAIRLKDMDETVQNLYQLLNHGFVSRTLGTNHYPYFLSCPDLQGAFPAILLEMAVFAKPGTVELLPAMPDCLGEGIIEGVWLYTWAKLEQLRWDGKGIRATLTSAQAQSITLRCRRHFSSLRINGETMICTGDHVQYAFDEGEQISIEIDY